MLAGGHPIQMGTSLVLMLAAGTLRIISCFADLHADSEIWSAGNAARKSQIHLVRNTYESGTTHKLTTNESYTLTDTCYLLGH
ncbi:hypothetical protein B0J13DRAFT_567301 [Dactylonectria estremocensis]|uniref:Secreted protein n=1 Tax=Dactylonectria estremocensis TaxID=1079267 RepID=A0A9P9DME3_9HYPO|nr:hypothetical protein B0J13DRAFT_567301 [Dactylonectria estremocensis]